MRSRPTRTRRHGACSAARARSRTRTGGPLARAGAARHLRHRRPTATAGPRRHLRCAADPERVVPGAWPRARRAGLRGRRTRRCELLSRSGRSGRLGRLGLRLRPANQVGWRRPTTETGPRGVGLRREIGRLGDGLSGCRHGRSGHRRGGAPTGHRVGPRSRPRLPWRTRPATGPALRPAVAATRRERLLQLARHRRFHRRGSTLDELPHLLELGQDDLALHTKLLGELVYAGLACHWTPRLRPAAARSTSSLRMKRCHRWRFTGCSSGRPTSSLTRPSWCSGAGPRARDRTP